MSKVEKTRIHNLSIEGYSGDYVYETIKKTKDYYEIGLLKKWLPYIQNSKVILDIGANLGNHTLFWASHLCYEKIFSFEPYKPNYERLCRNVAENNLENVYPICKGVASTCGFTTITEFHEDNYGGTTLNQTITEQDGEIPLISVDSFCEGNHVSQIDFIKIDTEGFEVSVLRGMTNCLHQLYPDIWVEVSPASFSAVMGILSDPGYVLVDVEGFNMLFLSSRRHKALKQVNLETVLSASFHNLERVNLYYKNYNMAKEWLASKNKKLEEAQQQIQKYRTEAERMKEQLLKCFYDYDFNISRIEQLSHTVNRLEIQNNTLIQKNNEQKAILDKIDNNFFGRAAVKLYHLYQKIFRK